MKLLSVIGFLSAPSALARGTEGLRGARWNAAGDDTNLADVGGDDDAHKSGGDFIDQYIAAAGKSTGDVWMKSSDGSKDSSKFGASVFNAERDSQASFGFDSDSRSTSDAAGRSQSASNDMDRFFDVGSMHHGMSADDASPLPKQTADPDTANSQDQGQTSGGGGAVIDVRLDSELQLSGSATRRHRKHWSDNAGDTSAVDVDDDKPSDSGDYMDRYIASTKDSGGGVWLKKPEASAGSSDRDITAFSAHSDRDSDSSPFRLPRSIDIMESQASGAGSSDAQQEAQPSGGTSVSVTLDSELQESARGSRRALLQLEGKPSMDPAAVRADVDAQMMQDIHIHDSFGQAATADVVQEEEINASQDMKA